MLESVGTFSLLVAKLSLQGITKETVDVRVVNITGLRERDRFCLRLESWGVASVLGVAATHYGQEKRSFQRKKPIPSRCGFAKQDVERVRLRLLLETFAACISQTYGWQPRHQTLTRELVKRVAN